MSVFKKNLSSLGYFFVVFLESWILPTSIDALFMRRALILNERQLWKLAFFSTLFSVLGGTVGYSLGWVYEEPFANWVIGTFGHQDIFFYVKKCLQEWGGWVIVAKAFVPLPYKLVCLAAGLMHMPWWVFLGASFFARSLRFLFFSFILSRPSSLERLIRRWHKPLGSFFLSLSIFFAILGLYPLIKHFLSTLQVR